MTRSERARLAGALFVGAVLAFPVGMTAARLGEEAEPAARPRAAAPATRNMFSPSVRSDPWFIERQREGVEALDQHCAQTGEGCPVARAARLRLAELEAGG